MSTIQKITKFISLDPSTVDDGALTDDDWEEITVTAIVLGLAPLLHWNLEQRVITTPPMALAKLGVTRQAHAKRNQAIAVQLAEILSACGDRQIEVIVLKGALLAPLAYPDAALRPMNDIDLLFRPQDLSQAGAIFEDLGYVGKHTDASQGPGITKHLSTYRRTGDNGSTPNPYLSAAGDRMVEPHGSLEESWFELKVDITPGVWDRAVAFASHNYSGCRLSTNDLIIHLSVHAAFHVIMGASVFLQLFDIGRVIETWPNELDWSQIVKSTRRAAAQPFVYAGLYWAKNLYKTPIPADVLQTLKAECPLDLAAYIHALDADGLFNRTQQPPLATLKQRLQRGVQDRREAARWAGSMGEKWRIWQTAFTFYKTDTAGLFMGKQLKTET